jgi:uncharacterized glyoxalase superfamily protein PhnB
VVEDVDAAYQQLLNEGIQFVEPPTEKPWRLRTATFLDPAGYTLTITSYPKGHKEVQT